MSETNAATSPSFGARAAERARDARRRAFDVGGAWVATCSPPRRDLLPREAFLTTTSLNATRGCHNRCDFCYLATDGLKMPYRMRDPAQVVEGIGRTALSGVHRQYLGSNKEHLRRL